MKKKIQIETLSRHKIQGPMLKILKKREKIPLRKTSKLKLIKNQIKNQQKMKNKKLNIKIKQKIARRK